MLDFLSDTECDALVEQASGQLKQSFVSGRVVVDFAVGFEIGLLSATSSP